MRHEIIIGPETTVVLRLTNLHRGASVLPPVRVLSCTCGSYSLAVVAGAGSLGAVEHVPVRPGIFTTVRHRVSSAYSQLLKRRRSGPTCVLCRN